MRQLCSTLAVIALLSSGTAAHHEIPGRTHDLIVRVRLMEPVLAGGHPIAPGTYEIVVTDRPTTLPSGEINRRQRWVDFVQDGRIVAREVAAGAISR